MLKKAILYLGKIIFIYLKKSFVINVLDSKDNCVIYNCFILKRVIVDYKKLTPKILNLLVEKFPDGYGIRDIIHFTNHKGQYVDAVEVKTEDTIYLVKISDELVDSMENHEEDDDDSISTDIVDEIDLDETELDDDK